MNDNYHVFSKIHKTFKKKKVCIMTEQMSNCSIFLALSNAVGLEINRCPHQKLYLKIYGS